MLTTATQRAPEDFLGALDLAPHPMFVLSVGPRLDFRFAMSNAAHALATGLCRDNLIGKRPDEVLPARIADTALENYRECCVRGAKFTFQENLDLPTGRCWWQTTLVPVFGAGEIHSIVGSSVDISSLKEEAAIISLEYQRFRARADRWRDVVTNAIEKARGPLNNILSLSRMLQFEKETPEETDTIATLLEDTAARSIRGLDDKAMGMFPAILERRKGVDFGQLCREFAAFADPNGALDITIGDHVIQAESAIVRLLVHALADQAAEHAATFVHISVMPSPIDATILRLIFELDTHSGSRMNLAQLGTMCQMHGVQLRHVIHGAVHRVEFLLPNAGRDSPTIIEPRPVQLRSSA